MILDLGVLRKFAEQVSEDCDSGAKDNRFKVVGVTFDNRQALIEAMTKDTKVRLIRERSNEFDFYAVGVEAKFAGKWAKIGYLPKEKNKQVAEMLDKHIKVTAHIERFNDFFCDVVKNAAKGLTIIVETE